VPKPRDGSQLISRRGFYILILLPIEKTPVSRERSCLILKPVINENEIEFCRKALMLQMINFSQLLENLLRWIFTLNTLRWALVARAL